MTLDTAEPPPALDPAQGSVAPGRDRTRERISEIIRALNELFGDDLSEKDRLKVVANFTAISELVGRDATVGKQIAAKNSEEQMMQGGDLLGAVRSAVIDLLVDSRDNEIGDALLKDGDKNGESGAARLPGARERSFAGRPVARRVYLPRVDRWQVFDNSGESPSLLEEGSNR